MRATLKETFVPRLWSGALALLAAACAGSQQGQVLAGADLGAPPLVAPAVGMSGTPFTIDLLVTAPLAKPPEVTLQLATPAPIPCTAAPAANHYLCTYTATGQELGGQDGSALFDVKLTGKAGQVTLRKAAGALRFDFHAPTLATNTITPAVAHVGSTIEGFLAVTELIRSDATVQLSHPLGGSSTLALKADPGTLNYRFSYTVAAADVNPDTPTHVDFTVTLQDVAGNEAKALPIGSVTLDSHPFSVMSPSVNHAYAKEGTQLEATFALTSALPVGMAPRVTMGNVTFAQDTSVTAPQYRFTHTVTRADGEGIQPVLVAAAAGSGEVLATSLGTVVLDFTPPTLTTALARPDPAGVGETLTLTIQPSEPLDPTQPPQLTVNGPGTVAFTPAADSMLTFTHAVTAADSPGNYSVDAQLVDLAGNQATITKAASFTLVQGTPTVAHLQTDAPRYSAQSGHNAVQVTFDVPSSVGAAGGGVVVSLNGKPLTCGDYQAQSPNFTCSYTVTGMEPPGTQTITVRTHDAAGDMGTATTSVVFDFDPPQLQTATVSPSLAGLGAQVLYLISANEELSAPPTVTTSGAGSLAFDVLPNTAYILTHVVGVSDAAGHYTTLVTMTDTVGNTATGLMGAAFDVLTQPPQILHAKLNASRYSAVSGFNAVTLTFDTSVSLDAAPASLAVTLGSATMSCGTYQATSPNYTCTYTVSGNELAADGTTPISQLPSAVLPVIIQARDAAGNVGFGSAFATLDFSAPQLTGPATLMYIPAATGALTVVTAATYGTDVRLGFVLNEAVQADPNVTSTLGAFKKSSGGGSNFVYDFTVQKTMPTPAEGAYPVQATVMDTVGNSGTLPLLTPGFTLVTTPPAAPDTSTAGQVIYTRAPWGRNSSGGTPAFTVQGTAAVGGAGRTLLVFDGSDPASAHRIGQGAIDASGTFGPITLTQQDRLGVYVAVADAAGNVSPTSAVHDVTWVASLDGKVPGSLTANPHVFTTTSVETPALAQTAARTAEPTAAAIGNLATVDGNSVTATAELASWQPITGAQPGVRYGGAMVYDAARGRLVLFGGLNGSYLADTREWDGLNWILRSPMTSPSGRYQHAMAWDPVRGRAVLFGGSGPSGNLGDTWEWDGTNWISKTPMTAPPARYQHSMAWDPVRGRVILFGGYSSAGAQQDTWEWDGTNWTNVTPASGNPPVRYGHAIATDLGRNKVVLFGGYNGPYYADTWEWDGTSWTNKTPASGNPPGRYLHTLAYDPVRAKTVLFAGNNGGVLQDAWEWNGTAWTNKTPASNLPATRYQHMMAYDSVRSRTIVFGGYASGYNGETWGWDGTAWTNLGQTTATPSARTYTAMAYDSNRKRTVLFSGGSSTAGSGIQDTWEWDGNIWTNRSPGSTPSGRFEHALAFDSNRNKTVLFGGATAATNASLADTWEWDGTTWTNRTPGSSPAARQLHALAFDSGRNKTVLFGGAANSAGAVLQDTWEWDGTAWSNRTPANGSPSARSSHALAYDPGRGRTVLFGGTNGNAILQDTWEWDGTNWTNKTPASGSPPARTGQAMVYSPTRKRVVLFGGFDGATTYNQDLWEWDGTSWTNVTSTVTNPPVRTGSGFALDPNGQLLLFGGYSSAGSVLADTWACDESSLHLPVAIATMNWTAVNDPTAVVQQVTFDAFAGGHADMLGVLLSAWDTTSGTWDGLAVTGSDTTAPSELSYSSQSTAEAMKYFFNGTLSLALQPTAMAGNSAQAPQLAVDYVEVQVKYRR